MSGNVNQLAVISTEELAQLRESHAALLAALINLALEARHYYQTGGGGTHLTDSINRANAVIAALQPVACEWHDDRPDERADRFAPTQPGDLDLAGRPMRPGS